MAGASGSCAATGTSIGQTNSVSSTTCTYVQAGKKYIQGNSMYWTYGNKVYGTSTATTSSIMTVGNSMDIWMGTAHADTTY